MAEKPDFEDVPDLMLFMWTNEDTYKYFKFNGRPQRPKTIVFIRRYEFYTGIVDALPWQDVDEIVVVNDFFAEGFERTHKIKPHVIHNGVNLGDWTFKERSHGKKIACVSRVATVKNLPLAVQIMIELNARAKHESYVNPKPWEPLGGEYELHIAGTFQSSEMIDYVMHIAREAGVNVCFYGPVDNINKWLEDKNYLLNTSHSEGCPNGVIEAMAKGLKPVVHNWPGAKKLFEPYVFNTLAEAVEMISPESNYESHGYRLMVGNRYSDNCYRKMIELIEKTCQSEPGGDV